MPYCQRKGPFSCKSPSRELHPGPPFNQIVISSSARGFVDGKYQKKSSLVSFELDDTGRSPAYDSPTSNYDRIRNIQCIVPRGGLTLTSGIAAPSTANSDLVSEGDTGRSMQLHLTRSIDTGLSLVHSRVMQTLSARFESISWWELRQCLPNMLSTSCCNSSGGYQRTKA